MPREHLRHAFLVHPSVFINETLALINSHYIPPEQLEDEAVGNPEIEEASIGSANQREVRSRMAGESVIADCLE